MSSNLSRGLQSKVDDTSIEDGKIRFAIDTGRLFLDVVNERIEFTDFVKGLTYNEIMALEDPLPKVYLSSDTHQMLVYDYAEETWVVYGGNGGEVRVLEARVAELEATVQELTEAIEIIKLS